MDSPLNSEGSRANTAVRTIDRKGLVNRFNYLNFQDQEIISVFKHRKYERSLFISVKPGPCRGSELFCSWADSPPKDYIPGEYTFDHLQIDDGVRTITVSPESYTLANDGFSFDLPETGIELAARRIKRHPCRDVRVQMIQNGRFFKGTLSNFTPESLKVDIPVSSRHEISLVSSESPVSLTMLKEGRIVYSDECSILRSSFKNNIFSCILKPVKDRIQKYNKKEYRGHRVTMVPAPNLLFRHPLSGETVNLPVSDLSGSGFSVDEYLSTGTLLPGMIIPQADIIFSTNITISCKLQVLYRRENQESKYESEVEAGLCFLDMKPEDHVKLLSLISKARNRHIYLGQGIDSRAFWSFIFDTGFIYPEKYAFVHENKNRIKEIYDKIYNRTPSIARHVTYQENGRIQGHLSMLRVYDDTWMIHHHASSSSSANYAGISVLDHLSDYIYNAYHLPTMHLDYVMCYYRPENKFPAKVFGGARKAVNNPKGCSEDTFAYLNINIDREKILDEVSMPRLEESSDRDLNHLNEYYEKVSGGIMLDAMSILPDSTKNSEVRELYGKEGLKRDTRLFSLKDKDELLAVFFIDITETGLNLSELTNSVKVFVIEPEKLTKEVLEASLNETGKMFYRDKMSVLVYPADFMEKVEMEFKKRYILWVTDMEHTDPYFKYVNRFFRLAGDK